MIKHSRIHPASDPGGNASIMRGRHVVECRRLLETLRRYLSEVGCDPRLTARWLGELQTLHLDVLQGSARGAVICGSDVDASHSAPARVPIPVSCGCAIGDWIEWAREDVGRVRLKLVAWNPAREELLFFDRQGRFPTRFSARITPCVRC